MIDYTISENYTLPSLGKVYSPNIDPIVTLRSMTTNEEMRRLNPSERSLKTLAGIIDDCLVKNPGISSYDMCLADYQFLLHKLRVVTYGTDYKIKSTCPFCGGITEETINLDDFEVVTYSEDLAKYLNFVLPKSKKTIKLKMQSPRILDDIQLQTKERQKKVTNKIEDFTFLFLLMNMIDEVDGKKIDFMHLEDFVRNLPMADTNYIIQAIKKFNEGMGLKTQMAVVCDGCGLDYPSSFRETGEFFGPTVDF